MPFDGARLVAQYVHVFAGILWLGGGFYTLLVLLPSLAAAPAQARGPVMGEVVPRQITYILRVAELTIATGILNAFLTGKLAYLSEAPLWGLAIGLGAAIAIALYVVARARQVPLLYRVLALGRQAAQGDPAAAQEIALHQRALERIGYFQIVAGVVIVFLMVLARFT